MPKNTKTDSHRFPLRMNSLVCNYVSIAQKLGNRSSQAEVADDQSTLKSFVAFVGKCVEESSQGCNSRSRTRRQINAPWMTNKHLQISDRKHI